MVFQRIELGYYFLLERVFRDDTRDTEASFRRPRHLNGLAYIGSKCVEKIKDGNLQLCQLYFGPCS